MSTVEIGPAARVVTPVRADVTLQDKYTSASGPALMSGIHALVRLLLEQRRLDARRGLDTGIFVSGYEGSPLGGFDQELARCAEHLDPLGIVFRPGLNEELAATAVSGTQLLGELPEHEHDGIVGFWYGKNPGLDRAADAIRHGVITGTAPLGGAVALIGDDPAAKSSTLPSASESLCRSLMMPLLAPSTVREIVVLGLHAVALSRESGLWTGLKIVTEIADGSATVDVAELATGVPAPSGRPAAAPPILLGPGSLDAEQDAMTARLDRVHAYARRTGLNHIAYEPEHPRIAIVAAGVAFAAVQSALDDLGFDEAARNAAGLRLVKLGMPWPLERDQVRELLGDVEQVLVVEDKRAFVESQIKEALYRCPDAPLIVGKQDAEGRELLAERGTLGTDDVTRAIARVLGHDALPEDGRARMHTLEPDSRPSGPALAVLPTRTPYFCSGCPHNASTKVADDQLVGAGIGCHVMVALDVGGRGKLLGMPQMGGEGAQWLGLAPFAKGRHFVQNLGDGTFHHSGSLAIRAAVAADVDMTYKLLYNDAVAMTGGQRAVGRLDVASITRLLAVEGVKRIIVTTADLSAYKGVALDPIAEVRDRDQLAEAQRELAEIPGVTVLIHDDRCAAQERRLRKRGKLAAPPQRVLVNERVCEGCGDCGEQSTCLSVVPVQTPFGRKTQIHQGSCNQDFSCLKGDCPSFMEVVPGRRAKTAPPELPVALPEPALRVSADDIRVRMPGIGGTGVVTISQILQMAAHLDGLSAAGVDQTGLAQKGGPVISDLRISCAPINGQVRAGTARADVLIGFDVLGAAAAATLEVADRGHTIAVVNTAQVATAEMVTDTAAHFPAPVLARAAINRATRVKDNLFLDAGGLSERLFADHMPANMITIGAAFQHGCLPLSAASIEAAIRLNGAAVEGNLAAFAWGRAAVADPAAVEAALAPPSPPARREPPAAVRAMLAAADAHGSLGEVLERCVPELADYQSRAYAQAYVDKVLAVAAIERDATGAPGTPVATAYAHGLHKLMAYKDEYEVARLYLDPVERARIRAQFGAGAKVRVLLHPPLLRALGVDRKLRLGPWIFPVFRGLRALRRLRGTMLDPFGHTQVRKVERALAEEYDALVMRALERLTPATVDDVVAVAELPDVVRGYEEIKLRNVARFRERGSQLLGDLETERTDCEPAGRRFVPAVRRGSPSRARQA
jgi:indolepyruvate ferredoxin oxidoreductase